MNVVFCFEFSFIYTRYGYNFVYKSINLYISLADVEGFYFSNEIIFNLLYV